MESKASDISEAPGGRGGSGTPLLRSATAYTPGELRDFAVKMIGFYPDTSPLIKPLPRIKSLPHLSRLPVTRYDSFDEVDNANGKDGKGKENNAWDEDGGVCSFREGSIRASVFNLCSATLGAGALSLPFAFKEAGFVS